MLESAIEEYRVRSEPYYLPIGREVDLFEAAHSAHLPVILKGPTGCGKTRFVEHMAWRLERPLITVACHEDLSATDLVGRFLLEGEETVWHDGPLTSAVRNGAICYLDEVVEAHDLPGGEEIVTDQVLYNLAHRGIEWDLLPWCRAHGIPVMAYSPLESTRPEQRALLTRPQLGEVARRHGVTPAQVALAWLLAQDDDIAPIPGTKHVARVEENAAADAVVLTEEQLARLTGVPAAAGDRYGDMSRVGR